MQSDVHHCPPADRCQRDFKKKSRFRVKYELAIPGNRSEIQRKGITRFREITNCFRRVLRRIVRGIRSNFPTTSRHRLELITQSRIPEIANPGLVSKHPLTSSKDTRGRMQTSSITRLIDVIHALTNTLYTCFALSASVKSMTN